MEEFFNNVDDGKGLHFSKIFVMLPGGVLEVWMEGGGDTWIVQDEREHGKESSQDPLRLLRHHHWGFGFHPTVQPPTFFLLFSYFQMDSGMKNTRHIIINAHNY